MGKRTEDTLDFCTKDYKNRHGWYIIGFCEGYIIFRCPQCNKCKKVRAKYVGGGEKLMDKKGSKELLKDKKFWDDFILSIDDFGVVILTESVVRCGFKKRGAIKMAKEILKFYKERGGG